MSGRSVHEIGKAGAIGTPRNVHDLSLRFDDPEGLEVGQIDPADQADLSVRVIRREHRREADLGSRDEIDAACVGHRAKRGWMRRVLEADEQDLLMVGGRRKD
jgi:hypothetical protein